MVYFKGSLITHQLVKKNILEVFIMSKNLFLFQLLQLFKVSQTFRTASSSVAKRSAIKAWYINVDTTKA